MYNHSMYRELSHQISLMLSQPHPPIILILGLRQTGKSTLVDALIKQLPHQRFSFDLVSDRKEFLNQNRHALADFATRYQNTIVFIDEVQKCPEATNIIKHLYDVYKLKFIMTGSSELLIKKHMGDSLAGRLRQFRLYPLSLHEIAVQRNLTAPNGNLLHDRAQQLLQTYLIYGSLPNLENISIVEHSRYLSDFIESLLAKDILEIAHITKSTHIFALAKLLALQIGQLVNVNELATLTELSRNSIYHYLDIFEQLNLIFRVYPLSTNNRRAISAKFKVYFTDIGLRNALIGNFSPLHTRLDGGNLLENAVFMGMKRHLDYTLSHRYELGFFRSINGSELDMVVKTDGKEQLYEIKSSPKYMNKKGIVTYITMQNAWEYLQ